MKKGEKRENQEKIKKYNHMPSNDEKLEYAMSIFSYKQKVKVQMSAKKVFIPLRLYSISLMKLSIGWRRPPGIVLSLLDAIEEVFI